MKLHFKRKQQTKKKPKKHKNLNIFTTLFYQRILSLFQLPSSDYNIYIVRTNPCVASITSSFCPISTCFDDLFSKRSLFYAFYLYFLTISILVHMIVFKNHAYFYVMCAFVLDKDDLPNLLPLSRDFWVCPLQACSSSSE